MNITRISAEYRADGMERAVVGFDYDTGRWTLEEGHVTERYASHTFVATDIDYFDDSTAAMIAQRDRGYR